MHDVRQRLLLTMAEAVSLHLPAFDENSGRFLSIPDGPIAPGAKSEDIGWIVINQDIIYPLALLYTTPGTQFYQDENLLKIALRAGDAIRHFQYPNGQVEFLKVDGSRWGPIYMCWTNYAWLEAYALLLDHLGKERKERWSEGLTLAHNGQAKEIETLNPHNIPCWMAMSCYRAGQIFSRPDWQASGTALIKVAVANQRVGGYWAEHEGPTTLYNYLYVHALGLYYKFSGDTSLLPVLEAATEFHQNLIYPDGVPLETVDGRVKYFGMVWTMGMVGFSTCPKGRRLTRFLAEKIQVKRDFKKNYHCFQGAPIASAVQHMFDGDEADILLDKTSYHQIYDGYAVLLREGSWFGALSTFVSPPTAIRWSQDRQSFLSLWHEKFGLILGGGNSKDQPGWSNFIADGRFMPDKGEIIPNGKGIALSYGRISCLLNILIEDGKAVIESSTENGSAVQQFIVQAKTSYTIRTATGNKYILDKSAIRLTDRDIGKWLSINDCKIFVPEGTEFSWPTTPFNPYSADGAPAYGSERGILSTRIDGKPIRWVIET